MNRDINEYKERHLAFWSLQDVASPLIGFTIGAGLDSWSYWKYNKAALELMNKQNIVPDDIDPIKFIAEQLQYLKLSEQIDDDICRSAMPLASVPWMEAILGCRVFSSEDHMDCEKVNGEPDSISISPFDHENPWVQKYIEFIEVYKEGFGEKYPVAQSVIRGPSDLASAMLGIENASVALLTNPDGMHRLLEKVTTQLEQLLKLQGEHLPKFQDGYVIGQYEIWAPEPVIRFQEDSSILYSPELYDEFLKPLDRRLASLSNYSLIHLHSPSLKLIDQFLDVTQITTFQITKDPGSVLLSEMIPDLQKIQNANKPLVLKGQFDLEDINLMKKNLTSNGLCIQPVVSSLSDAQKLLLLLRNWK